MTDDPSAKKEEKEKSFADSGWGVKPDDRPANAADADQHSVDTYRYDSSDPEAVKTIMRLQRRGFNLANRVVIQPGKITIMDVNGDAFEIKGLSYGDENLIELLTALGATFDPRQLRQLPKDCQDTREYTLSRVWAWGAERTG